jgi:hypothetical protein
MQITFLREFLGQNNIINQVLRRAASNRRIHAHFGHLPQMRQDVAPSDRRLLFRLRVCLYFHKAARVSQHGDADRGRHWRLVAEEAEIFLMSLA